MSRYEINFLPEYTDDALIAELRRVAALLGDGEPLTKTAFKRLGGRAGLTTLRRRFGDWRATLTKAGLAGLYSGHPVSEKMRKQPARGLTGNDLCAELRRVQGLTGKAYLTAIDFDRHSIVGTRAVRGCFGSFQDALQAAGIPQSPHSHHPVADEKKFENLAKVWTHYGRPPTYREMFRPPSAIRGKTYVTRWGRWRGALAAFVKWANSESGPEEQASAPNKTTPEPGRVRTRTVTGADRREVPPRLRWKAGDRDGFRCVKCGRSPATNRGITLQIDHVIPVARGGKTTLENLQTLCMDCNLGKGSLLQAPRDV